MSRRGAGATKLTSFPAMANLLYAPSNRARETRGTLISASEWMDKFGDWFVPEPNTGCWLWMRRVCSFYGVVDELGRAQQAHRVSYRLLRGPIPAGLTIDHLCRQTICVNPDHLEPVTHRENVLRGFSPLAQQARQTHCVHGHELCVANLHPYSFRHGRRACKECRRISQIAYRAKVMHA